MESGKGFSSEQIYSDAGASRSDGNAAAAAAVEGGDGASVVEHGYMRKAEEYIPIANIMRIMRRTLPPQAKVADDAKETIQECVTEFISYVTAEANGRCHRECRKTVTAEDIISAIRGLGFDDYVYPLTLFLHNHRAQGQGPHRSVVVPSRVGGSSGSGSGGGGGDASARSEFGQYFK